MKSFIQKVWRWTKITVILITIVAIGAGVYLFLNTKNSTTLDLSPKQVSEYDKRVEQKMQETAIEWEEKHKVWAEQEVSREIIVEQESKLELLKEKELSF